MPNISNYSTSGFSFQKPEPKASEIDPGKDGLKAA
jgi:hypothetical protein